MSRDSGIWSYTWGVEKLLLGSSSYDFGVKTRILTMVAEGLSRNDYVMWDA